MLDQIPEHFPFVILDEFMIMPNHIHGIIIIDKMDDDMPASVQKQYFASPDDIASSHPNETPAIRPPSTPTDNTFGP